VPLSSQGGEEAVAQHKKKKKRKKEKAVDVVTTAKAETATQAETTTTREGAHQAKTKKNVQVPPPTEREQQEVDAQSTVATHYANVEADKSAGKAPAPWVKPSPDHITILLFYAYCETPWTNAQLVGPPQPQPPRPLHP
jgi:hypothetical protein